MHFLSKTAISVVETLD